MQYTLITASGKIMQFYLRPVAELYQTIYGGQVIDSSILVQAVMQSTVLTD